MAYRRDELRWNGWGLKSATFDLHGHDAEVWEFVAGVIGVASLPRTPAPDLAKVELPAASLPDAVTPALVDALDESRVLGSNFERAFHAYGRSYPDMIQLRSGSLEVAPAAVVYPDNAAEVAAVLNICAAHNVAVIPFGGGSSVVGGVEARSGKSQNGVVTLDTTRMRRMLDLDEVSHTATFEAGIYGPELEAALQERGYTLGHFPQSFEFSTLGGWIAARGAGQQSNRYGTANKWLVAATVVTPEGEIRTLPFPQSAAGPDLNEIICGSEGVLGVITKATVKVHRMPETRDIRAYLFKDFRSGVDAVRRIAQSDVSVAMMRLSDSDESYFFGTLKGLLKPSSALTRAGEKALAVAGYVPGEGDGRGRCALMIGIEGNPHDVRHGVVRTTAMCVGAGGAPIGKGPGKSWEDSRFSMPYLRDPLLDHGVAIDTLETSTTWSNVESLAAKVRASIRAELGEHAAILCHISHSYGDGCSLYFTFFFARDLEDPIGQWRRVKTAASDAIAEGGGTISHHHGVGRDHAPWMATETGGMGMAMLRAAKKRVDPAGVLNPGKLLIEE